MKKAQYGGTPIKMPFPNPGIGGVNRFANQVTKALKSLRDRQVYVKATPVLAFSHPWKATANGDDTLKIADGGIIYWQPTGDGKPFYGTFLAFASTDIQITSASGTVYAKVTISDVAVNDYLDTWFSASSITLQYEPAMSGDFLYMPICTATLTDGIAAVGTQILRDHFQMK